MVDFCLLENVKEINIRKIFPYFVYLDGLTGKGIAYALLISLREKGNGINKCRGQS